MKNILASFLIITYLTNIGGYLFFYLPCKEILKENARQKITGKIQPGEMEIINVVNSTLNSGNLNIQLLEDNEIRLNGKLFDIVETIKQDSVTIFYCIADEPEDLLEKLIQDNFEDGDLNYHKKNIKNLFKSLITDLFFENKAELTEIMNWEPFFYFDTSSHISQTNKILTPPPQYNS